MCEYPDAGQPVWPSTGQNAAGKGQRSTPQTRLFACRVAPHSRLTRVILIGDEIFTTVGGYVLTSVIAHIGGARLRRLDAS
jgi:hypothetical protein